MTCKEVLKRLKKKLGTKKIKVVEECWSQNFVEGVCEVYPSSLLCKQIILKIPYSAYNSKKYIIEKVIVLLHEIGHMYNDQQKTFDERVKNINAVSMQILRLCSKPQREIIIRDEKDAWDEGWKRAIKFGLNKNRNFKEKFLKEKIRGLISYGVPLKDCCI